MQLAKTLDINFTIVQHCVDQLDDAQIVQEMTGQALFGRGDYQCDFLALAPISLAPMLQSIHLVSRPAASHPCNRARCG